MVVIVRPFVIITSVSPAEHRLLDPRPTFSKRVINTETVADFGAARRRRREKKKGGKGEKDKRSGFYFEIAQPPGALSGWKRFLLAELRETKVIAN